MPSTTTETTTQNDLNGQQLEAPPPEHCPGPTSSTAGTASSCAGCPNQSICASGGAAAPDPDLPIIARNLAEVKHKILVLSGKGGVGKSTFSSLLGWGLGGLLEREAESKDEEAGTVGILDLDITGPSLPKMLGVEGESVHVSSSGWSPIYLKDNICTMSIQFLLPTTDSAIIWRGAKKSGMVKRFLRDVEWGALEYLVIDTPPGTSDEHLSINTLLQSGGGITGAILITTPQEVALLDVRREADFCRKAGIKILGVVENMSAFVCPHCTKSSEIFKATTGGGEKLAEELGTRFLGRVPLDPRIGVAGDYGESPFEVYPESEAVRAIERVVEGVRGVVEGR